MNDREEIKVLLEQVDEENPKVEEFHFPKDIPISLEERWLKWVEVVDN